MILSFIEETLNEVLSSNTEPAIKTEEQAAIYEKETPVNTSQILKSNEGNSFEQKYTKLIQQLEKERFEREIITGSR